MKERDTVFVKQRQCEGGSHARAAALPACCGVNGQVCLADDLFGKMGRFRLSGTRPELIDLGTQALTDDFRGHTAGDVTSPVPANAIGDHGEPEFLVDGDGVFIERADTARIGQAGNLKREVNGFQSLST